LVLTSVAVLAVALALPFSPLAPVLGFAALPAIYFAWLAALLLAYLLAVEVAKQWFYKRRAWRAGRAG
jgi:Mg2+-importing ATPase